MHPNNQRHYATRTLVYSLLLATAIWVSLLLIGATNAQQETHSYLVTLGPLVLNTITHTSLVDGQSVTISVEPGVIWYFAGTALIGLAWGWFAGSHKPR